MADEIKGKPPVMNYPGNSHNAKQSADKPSVKREPIEKVITGKAVQRKPSLGRRIVGAFGGEDAKSVGSFVVFDVLIPAAKNAISDAVSQAVERFFFGDSRPRSSMSRGGGGGYTSYNRMYPSSSSGSGRRDEPRTMSNRARATHDFGEVILETRGEAELILERLSDLVKDFDVAAVSDLYELAGITGSFTDNKWGWTDLRGSSIRLVRGGYLLELPRPEPID